MTAPKIHPHAQIVEAAIAAAGIAVDIGRAPTDGSPDTGYAVVWPRSATTGGPVADVHADLSPEIQVTAVSTTAGGAGIIADRVLAALLTTVPAPPAGRAWMTVPPIQFVEALASQRDDGTSPPLYSAPVVVRLDSTPV